MGALSRIRRNLVAGIAARKRSYSSVGEIALPTTGLMVRLDFDDVSTITKDASNNISQINDKSGNGNNFTATLTERPVWGSGSGILGDKGRALFNGTSNLMRSSAFLSGVTNYTALFTYRLASTAVINQVLLSSADESGANDLHILAGWRNTATYQGPYTQALIGGVNKVVPANSYLTSDTDYIVCFQNDGSKYYIRVNAGDEVLYEETGTNDGTSFSGLSGLDNVVIGAVKRNTVSGFFSGYMKDVLVYNRVLTNSELKNAHQYLADDISVEINTAFTFPNTDFGVVATKLNGFGHWTVEKVGATYYAVSFNGPDNDSSLEVWSSADGESYTSLGNFLTETANWQFTAPEMRYFGGVMYLYGFYKDKTVTPNRYDIRVYTNSDFVNNPLTGWTSHVNNPMISYNALGDVRVVDPEFMYFPSGFSNGVDGTHNYWMMVAKETGTVEVQARYLFYSDALTTGWTIANGGSPVLTAPGTDDMYPGCLIKQGSTIYLIQSYRDEKADYIYLKLWKTSDLINWTFISNCGNPQNMGGNGWAITPDFVIVGSELWMYVTMNNETVHSLEDTVRLYKFALNSSEEI